MYHIDIVDSCSAMDPDLGTELQESQLNALSHPELVELPLLSENFCILLDELPLQRPNLRLVTRVLRCLLLQGISVSASPTKTI